MTGEPTADARARVVLARLVEPGSWPVHRAVAQRGAEDVAAALAAGAGLPDLPAPTAAAAQERARGLDVDAELAALQACGGRLLVPGDDEWPEARLHWSWSGKDLAAPPLHLQLRGPGRLDALAERAVAVVGARAATSYGAHVAQELALGLADQGHPVVSGGAYGVDAAAHRGALASAAGATVAVLACGVDVAYPRGNDRLLGRIAATGLLVSEQAPGASPTRRRFLVRNRLIAALSRGVVVVEAAVRSGSLSTAHRAHDLQRLVMAVPGPVTSALSAGCHALLRADAPAALVTGVGEVVALVGEPGEGALCDVRAPARLHDGLAADVRAVLEAVPVRGGAGEATVARAAGVAVLTVQMVLPELLVAGLVRRSDTGWVLTPLGQGR